jgi:hypothetical protein
MNVDTPNDFEIPILGAYYFVDLPTIEPPTSAPLRDLYKQCATATSGGPPPSAMVTQSDILLAMSTPPFGRQVKCAMKHIKRCFPQSRRRHEGSSRRRGRIASTANAS